MNARVINWTKLLHIEIELSRKIMQILGPATIRYLNNQQDRNCRKHLEKFEDADSILKFDFIKDLPALWEGSGRQSSKVKFKFFVRSYLTFHSGCESWRSTTTYYLVSQSFALLFYRGRINNWKCANTMEISCQELQTTTICPENSSSSYQAQWVKILSEGEHLFFVEQNFSPCN